MSKRRGAPSPPQHPAQQTWMGPPTMGRVQALLLAVWATKQPKPAPLEKCVSWLEERLREVVLRFICFFESIWTHGQ